ncbi:hypothetical protein D3C72_1493170 [compost metagenome]
MHDFLFTGLEHDFLEVLQFFHRTNHRAGDVLNVQLHHGFAVTLAGVLDHDAGVEFAGGVQGGRRQRHVTEGELGVAQAITEREQRPGRVIEILRGVVARFARRERPANG